MADACFWRAAVSQYCIKSWTEIFVSEVYFAQKDVEAALFIFTTHIF